MTDTNFFVTEDNPRFESIRSRFVTQVGPKVTNSTDPYSIAFGAGGVDDFDTNWAHVSRESAGGGSISTAKDYLKFVNMLRRQGVAEDGTRLMRRWTVRTALQSRHLNDASENAYGSVTTLAWASDYGWALIGGYSDGTFIFDNARNLPNADLEGSRNPSASPTRVVWGGACGTYWSVDLEDDVAVSGQACTRPSMSTERKIDSLLHDYLE